MHYLHLSLCFFLRERGLDAEVQAHSSKFLWAWDGMDIICQSNMRNFLLTYKNNFVYITLIFDVFNNSVQFTKVLAWREIKSTWRARTYVQKCFTFHLWLWSTFLKHFSLHFYQLLKTLIHSILSLKKMLLWNILIVTFPFVPQIKPQIIVWLTGTYCVDSGSFCAMTWCFFFFSPNIVIGCSQPLPWRWNSSCENWNSSPLFTCPLTFGTFLYNG